MDPIIVLFDGVCNLCNGLVDFAIRRDPSIRLRFAAQQSPAGQRLLTQAGLKEIEGGTIVVLAGERHYTHSRAALEIIRRLRAPWPLLYAFIILPPLLRDALYDWVVHHRYAWFGKRETCRVPTTSDREHFVD